MTNLVIGLVGALLATNQPQAVSNLIQQDTGISVAVANPDDPAEQALRHVMEDDDAALADVDQWIQKNNVLAASGAGESKESLNERIHARLDGVRKEYDDFLVRYPDSAHGHLAYGSFLDDIGQEDLAAGEFESASKLDPKNPAAWNDLANYCGESGSLTNAFADYARAIELDPTEPVYYQNLATTVYLFRKDAEKFYNINEQQVFDKALGLYQKAVQLDPENFSLATDYAETYYGIKPMRTNDALVAWTNALSVARTEVEREGVYIHLARIKLSAGQYAEAQAHLDAVTNDFYAVLKDKLERNLALRENPPTNPVVVIPPAPLPQISTNISIASTIVIPPTNALPVFTNQIPVLTNPPAFSPKNAPVLTNVPPVPSQPLQLEMPPPTLHPLPQTQSTDSR